MQLNRTRFFTFLFSIVAGLLFSPRPGRAQNAATGTIQGRVLDVRTGDYLVNVRVTIEGTPLEAFTDANGIYRVTNVPVGTVKLKTFYTGLPVQTDEIVVGGGQGVEHNITLAPAGAARDGGTVKLSQFVVSESREMAAAALAINEQRFAANIKTFDSAVLPKSSVDTTVLMFAANRCSLIASAAAAISRRSEEHTSELQSL